MLLLPSPSQLQHEGINQGVHDNHTYFCTGSPFQYTQPINNKVYMGNLGFLDARNNYLQCGKFHQPRYYPPATHPPSHTPS